MPNIAMNPEHPKIESSQDLHNYAIKAIATIIKSRFEQPNQLQSALINSGATRKALELLPIYADDEKKFKLFCSERIEDLVQDNILAFADRVYGQKEPCAILDKVIHRILNVVCHAGAMSFCLLKGNKFTMRANTVFFERSRGNFINDQANAIICETCKELGLHDMPAVKYARFTL